MEMRRKSNKKLKLFLSVIAGLVLVLLIFIVWLFVFRKNEEEAIAPDITEAIPVETPVEFDPEEIIVSAEYNQGILDRAAAYKDNCASAFSDISDDIARFSLVDINEDRIPELIMHDVIGKSAYYCTYVNGGISEPVLIYEAADVGGDTYNLSSYAALYPDHNIYIRYEFSDDRKRIESHFYSIDDASDQPGDLGMLVVNKGDDSFSYEDGNGNSISEDDYLKAFNQYMGDELFKRFFDKDMMIADGEYDFRSEYLWGGSAETQMTYSELEERCTFK